VCVDVDVAVPVADTVTLDEAEGDTVARGEKDTLTETVAEGLVRGEADAETDALCEGLGEGDGLPVAETDDVGDKVTVGL